MTSMAFRSFNINHRDGITIPDPGNSKMFLTMVGTWSEQDPSWEVRTFYLEPYYNLIVVVYAPMLIFRRRAGVITLTRGCPWLPFPLKQVYPSIPV